MPACGAFATAFVLIWLVGIRMTCATAMLASVAAGLIALRLSRRECFQNHPPAPVRKPVGETSGMPRPLIVGFAVLSGFKLLALDGCGLEGRPLATGAARVALRRQRMALIAPVLISMLSS